MTDASDIDGQLAVHGWHYHAGSETLLERDDNEIDWSNLLAALPDLSMNLLVVALGVNAGRAGRDPPSDQKTSAHEFVRSRFKR